MSVRPSGTGSRPSLTVFLLFWAVSTVVGSLKIDPKPCSNAQGLEGTCMFVWECIRTNGKHLGTCVDRFLFGSCCGYNDTENTIDTEDNQSSFIHTAQLDQHNRPRPTHLSTTTPASHSTTTAPSTTSLSITVTTPTESSVAIFKPTTLKPNHWFFTKPKPTPSNVWSSFNSTIVGHTFRPPLPDHQRPGIFRPPVFRPPISNNKPTSNGIRKPAISTTTVSTIQKPSILNFYKNTTDAKCGSPHLKHQAKVVGGRNAAFGAWPWQVSVRRTSFFGFSSTHRCGGALLSNKWIATAGHCVDDLLLSQIRIRVGEYDFANVMEPYAYVERAAKRKIVHPQYNFFTYENDLALVELDEPLEYQAHILPICLPPDDIELVGRNATVTGWGRLSEGGVLPSVLQEVRVPIVSNDKCKSMFLSAGRHEIIPEIFMCAGFEDGGRDSCQGDSGGPLQVQDDNGSWFLAGIISWGIGCAEPNLPGVCTRISRFKSWIVENIS